MKSLAISAFALLATLLPTAYAQTHTDCNPLNTTGCPSMEALGGNVTFNFTKKGISTDGRVWFQQNRGTVDSDENSGATFTIQQSGEAPMVQSRFYMLFGHFEIVMRAASGKGIVSSAILQSEALDEIDWEFLGSNRTHVLTNYFGKGNTTSSDRGHNFPMNWAPQDDFHKYAIDWTADRIQWWVDDNLLRELPYAEALGGRNYPQTPMNIRIGAWAGGDQTANDPGVVQWAGGETNFKEAPFTMAVQSIYAKDYTQGAEYSWDNMDASGDWQKVKVIAGQSSVLKDSQRVTGVRNRWSALPQGAKIGIIAGAGGILLVLICLLTFCCVKQRRAGRREHAAMLAQDQKEAAELQEYKKQMQAGKFGFGSPGGRGSHSNRVSHFSRGSHFNRV